MDQDYLGPVLVTPPARELLRGFPAENRWRIFINLRTGKALGLTVPPALLVAADEVIECGMFGPYDMNAPEFVGVNDGR